MDKGQDLELRVYSYLVEAVAAMQLGFEPSAAVVKRQQAYWSKAREDTIKVDLVIEVTRPQASKPYFMWVWECKNYAHAVPVDDIEEFHAKLQQIGANKTKGTVVTTSTFQKAAVTFAETMGIGLSRFLPDGSLIHLQESDERSIRFLAYQGLVEPDTEQLQSLFFSLAPSGKYVLDLYDLLEHQFERIEQDTAE